MNWQVPGFLGFLADGAATAALAIAVALVVHLVLFSVLRRVAKLSPMPSDADFVRRLNQPLRFAFVAVAISVAAETDPALSHFWSMVARFVIPALLGWTAFALVKAFAAAMDTRAELASDELSARSRRTRIAILSRTAAFVIVFVTVALMLLGIPGVRNVGVTLMASAGLAGRAGCAAAQPALRSLVAGIQMALTEPIRLGDHVVVDGEAGRVEDIRITYVVVRTADNRRLIVPTAKFLDATFQNWTRTPGGISGFAVLPIAPCHPIAPIRDAFLAHVSTRKEWDGRTAALHVADVRPGAGELRMTVGAADPASLADLRFAVREAMVEWLREHMPDAMCQPA